MWKKVYAIAVNDVRTGVIRAHLTGAMVGLLVLVVGVFASFFIMSLLPMGGLFLSGFLFGSMLGLSIFAGAWVYSLLLRAGLWQD